jgi:hypothetical protein
MLSTNFHLSREKGVLVFFRVATLFWYRKTGGN